MSKSTTSCLKELTFKDKQKLMLKDLEVELKQWQKKKGMAWWVMRLEDKINDLKGHINECNQAS